MSDVNHALYVHGDRIHANPHTQERIAGCQAMTAADHVMAAARLLAISADAHSQAEGLLLARAQVHATLATALRPDIATDQHQTQAAPTPSSQDTDDDTDGM